MKKRKRPADLPDNPAKFSEAVLDVIAENLPVVPWFLDNHGGVGKIGHLKKRGFKGRIIALELQWKWVKQAPGNGCDGAIHGNAFHLPLRDRSVPAIVTSITYATRMADHHNATDASDRNTYTHKYGEKLHPDNTGLDNWGPRYRYRHEHKIYPESLRVLEEGGYLLLNISRHYRSHQLVYVTEWHLAVLERMGFELMKWITIPTPRLRRGQNHELRDTHESLLVFRKPRVAS